MNLLRGYVVTGRIFTYHALGIDNLGASNFNLLCDALPREVGVWLADAKQDSRVSTNMGIVKLGEAHGFVWHCCYGEQEVGRKGFSVRIAPEDGTEMTLSEVKALEGRLLDRDCLRSRHLSVMPHCDSPEIMTAMRWNLNHGVDWGLGIQ